MTSQLKRGFSLIELSIVILIIGILIAGVTQGSRLVTAMKVNTAKTVTQSSPVSSIKGLSLWLETSTDNSFLTTEAVDQTQLTQWNDINPQSFSKFFALKTATAGVKYVEKSPINSLPSIYFDGTIANSQFSLSTSSASIVDTPIPSYSDNNAFTLFVVTQADFTKFPGGAWGYLLTNGTTAGGFSLSINSSNRLRSVTFWGGTDTSGGNDITTPQIASFTYAGTGAALNTYTNGGSPTAMTPANPTSLIPITRFIIGSRTLGDTTRAWSGYLSEVIFFDRLISNADRLAVEKYLSQKYSIKVS